MLAKDYPNVIVVGESTAGGYSDPLPMELPNGWKLGISNELYVAPDGQAYEGHGIPPHVWIPYFPEETARTGEDPVLLKALEVLAIAQQRGMGSFGKSQLRISTPNACGTAHPDA
jgi:C-terminal processing protease CtpA/Prc